jgi:hypothetical protein
LLRIDLRALHEFCKERERNRGKKVLNEMEEKLIETFRKIKNKNSNYFSSLIDGLFKSLQINIENFRLKIEFIDLAEPLVGGYELIFNELNYDNLVSNIVETRFEGEFLTNGLNIVDLRLKGLTKEKLILLKYNQDQLKKQTCEEFMQLFQNESNPFYLVYPFLLQANFTSMYQDITKETYKGVRSLEFSPLTFNVSNQDLQVASGFNGLLSTVQEYASTSKIYVSHDLRDAELGHYLAALRLNNLLFRTWSLKSIKYIKNAVAAVRKVKDEYIFCYETKIFNLMENEFESSSDRLYDLSLTMMNFDASEEKTIEDVINRCEEIEKSVHSSIVLHFRDQAMTKCRNSNYFKSKLIERKKFINAKKEKNAGLTGILRKGINKIWGSSTKDSEADIDKIIQAETFSKVDKEIKDSLIKNETKTEAIFEFKFPVIKICLSRNQKKLLSLEMNKAKYTEYSNFINKEGKQSFKLQNMNLTDGEGKIFFEIMRQSPKQEQQNSNEGDKGGQELVQSQISAVNTIYNCLEISITYPLVKDIETDTFNPGKFTAEISVENIHFSFNRELLSKLIYFSIDFSKVNYNQGSSNSLKPNKRTGSLSLLMNRILKMDEVYKTLKVSIRSVTLVIGHSIKHMVVGISFVPQFSLQKNQIDFETKELEIFFNEELIDFKKAIDLKEEIKQLPKLLRPFNISISLLRGTTNRLSLDIKSTNLEVFFSETFVDICSQIVIDFGSTKLLNTDSFLADLRRETKHAARPPKRKPLLAPRLAPLGPRKSSGQSRRVANSRKASGSALGSELAEDDFFDAFEDETELFAHNELKSKFDLLEHVGLLLPAQLAVIEEAHRFGKARFDDGELGDRLLEVELAVSLVVAEVVVLVYAKNDAQSYAQANISQLRVFSDFKEFSLKIKDISIFLKQNLLTLIMKDLANPISNILSMIKPTKLDDTDSPNKMNLEQQTIEEPNELRIYQKKAQTDSNIFVSIKQFILGCSESLSIEIDIENGLSLYMTQQIGQIVTPGMFFSFKPLLTFNAKILKILANFKLDVFNEEIGFYEPFIEELAAECVLDAEKSNLKLEMIIQALLLNLKPSILKNLFDYLSLYSSQKIKSSAERNSVITIKNETGVAITYVVNQSGVSKSLKPYEVVNVNLVFMPQMQESGSKLKQDRIDHSLSDISFVENKAALLKIVGRVGDDKINTNFENSKQVLSTSFFSKKKLLLEIPSFGVKQTLDLSNMTDAHVKLTEHIFLVAKLEVDNFHTVLTLRSNYRISNKLDFDVECSAYLHKSFYAKEEAMPKDLFAKKRKKSEVFSEGDNLSAADSIDLSVNEPFKRFNFSGEKHEKARTMAFEITEASEKEDRNILLFKFVIKSKGKKYLPLLKNFPKNYFILVRPAQLEFFESISTDPVLEMNQVKNQSLKFNRVYFDDLFRKSCSSRLALQHSVTSNNQEI